MTKLTASQKRLIDNATLNVASQLIFRKLEELNFPKTKVGNICSVCRGGSPRPKGDPKYFGGSIPWIMISDVSKSQGRYIYSTCETVTEEGAKKSRLLNKGTLIVTNSATIGLPKILGIDGCIHDGFLAFLDLSSDIKRDFLYCFFIKIRSYLETNAPQGTQKNINTNIAKSLEIPIPPIELQKAISTFIESVELRQNGDKTVDLPDLPIPLNNIKDTVAKVEELAGKIEEARSLREQTIKLTKAFFTSTSTKILGNNSINGHLFDVLLEKPKNGWSPRRDNLPTGIPVLSLGAVTGFNYSATEFKRTSESTDENAHYWLKEGDFLINRSNSPELVGHAAIYDGNPSPCIYPDLMMRLQIDESKADKRFVHFWLTCSPVRDYIKRNAKGTSPSMKKISQGVVMKIPFPTDISLPEQQRIVAYLDRLQSKVDEMKRLREHSLQELDALLPSILDKAFKGEL